MHADDEGVRLGAQGKGLEDLDRTVVAEKAGAQDLEVVGKLSVATFHLPENVPTLVPRLLKEAVENGKFEEEVTLRRKDGDVFRARLTVRPVFRDGKQVGFMGMTHPLEPPRHP